MGAEGALQKCDDAHLQSNKRASGKESCSKDSGVMPLAMQCGTDILKGESIGI